MRTPIAEADVASRTPFATVLRKAGHQVVETLDGASAQDALKQPGAPLLAILDWMMPGMDGIDAVRRVRALRSPQPYVVMLTTKGESGDVIARLNPAYTAGYGSFPWTERGASPCSSGSCSLPAPAPRP